MGLSYNEDTAVERDFKQDDTILTAYLNNAAIAGSSTDKITMPWSYSTEKTAAGITTDTYTLPQNIVLTGIYVFTSENVDCRAQPPNVDIRFIGFVGAGARNIFVNCPNWLIRTGEVITTYMSVGVAANSKITVTYVGYYLNR